jgi:asparagine synthetase B (glutamine-hydrolysing)
LTAYIEWGEHGRLAQWHLEFAVSLYLKWKENENEKEKEKEEKEKEKNMQVCMARIFFWCQSTVWSSNAKTLYLARDWLGVKPLFYSYLPEKDVFVFGSEAKSILQHLLVEPIVNFEGVQFLLLPPICLLHQTAFHDIRALPPGYAAMVYQREREGEKKREKERGIKGESTLMKHYGFWDIFDWFRGQWQTL